MIRFLAVLALGFGLVSWAAPASACNTVVGWVGIPLCQTRVQVPDVKGIDLEEADMALEAVSLDTGTVTTRCSAEEENIVLRQTPKAGAFVELGSLIDLVASSGEECPPSGKPVNSISIDIGIRL